MILPYDTIHYKHSIIYIILLYNTSHYEQPDTALVQDRMSSLILHSFRIETKHIPRRHATRHGERHDLSFISI
jgi:hypothetical protein